MTDFTPKLPEVKFNKNGYEIRTDILSMAKDLVAELNQLLNNAAVQRQIKNDYTTLKNIFTTGHNASEVAAQIIMEELK